jgi:hypothetical protein
MSIRDVPAPLTREWIPHTDVPWLEQLRQWHVGQTGAHQRARQAVTDSSGNYRDLVEDERLTAAELGRIIGEVARLVGERAGDPVVAQVDVSETTVAAALRWLRVDDNDVEAVAA